MATKLLIKNAKSLLQVREGHQSTLPVKGNEMAHLPSIEDAWLLSENGIIAAYGSMRDWKGVEDWNDTEIIDASGKFVLPTWCDSHTHIVFAETRENEFVSKIKGISYEEIARNGGGILNSANKLASFSEDELFDSANQRLTFMISGGTGAVEIKSGYGLTVDSEIKILRVIKRLKEAGLAEIKATFLGAHAVPLRFRANRKGYIDEIINEMLPRIVEEQLADFVDVFCDDGFFTVEETESILSAAAMFGLKPKIHANELANSGGVQVGIKYKAISVDHLECVGDVEIKALLNSETIPTLLPSTAFFLGIKPPDARRMINSGLPVSLATDYNPGSSPSGNFSFVISLACIMLKMLPEEAINAATLNSACAMNVQHVLGSITVGKRANLILTEEIPQIAYLPYSFGNSVISSVILNGKVVKP